MSACRCTASVGLWVSVSRGSCTLWSNALQPIPITSMFNLPFSPTDVVLQQLEVVEMWSFVQKNAHKQ
jgi:hypothetical protein